MEAIIISIGDELVLGQTVDTNSAHLSALLATMGIGTRCHETVGDDRAAIADAIRRAADRTPLVLVSGGLGPTEDDLTREALADALGVDLVLHPPSLDAIRAIMTRLGRRMPSRNAVQAMHPRGTHVIPNSCGTAPGIRARLGGATIYVTPGVPRELQTMFDRAIQPELAGAGSGRAVILTTRINTLGLGESAVAEKLEGLTGRDANPLVGTTVSDGIVAVRIRCVMPDATAAGAALEQTARTVEQRLGPVAFGREDRTLQRVLVEALGQRRLTLATAESCTGGLLGGMLTDVAGSSNVYVGGWITYANRMKCDHLEIHPDLIAQHGAVSRPVARAMARGARRRSGADLAVAITGIAGPDGGSDGKPVGTICIALDGESGADGNATTFEQPLRLHLPGNREAVRRRAARYAMQLVRFHLLGISPEHLTSGRRDKPT